MFPLLIAGRPETRHSETDFAPKSPFEIFKALLVFPLLPVLLFSIYLFGYMFLVKPYLRVKHYLQQGGIGNFRFGYNFYRKMQQDAIQYGDSFYTYEQDSKAGSKAKFFVESVGPRPLLILNDFNMVKEFLKGPDMFIKARYFKDLMKGISHESILFQEGEKWKQARKLLAPHFHSESVKDTIPIIVDSTKETFNTWMEKKNFKHNAMKMFSPTCAEVIMRYLFNTSHYSYQSKVDETFPAKLTKLASLSRQINQSRSRILLGPRFVQSGLLSSHKKFLQLKKECRKIAKDLLKKNLNDGLNENHLLYQLNQTKQNDEMPYNDERIVEEFLQLVEAGTDTTSHAIGFAIYFLSKHPEVQRKVREEVDRILVGLAKPTSEIVNKLEYTAAVVKETLRLCPTTPLFFPREALGTLKLGGVTIERGDFVSVMTQTFHMSETYYSKPKEFIPERWLPDGPFPDDGWKKEPFAYLPFSEGPRNCIGQHLAPMEIKLMLGLLVKEFNFKVPENYELKKVLKGSYEPIETLKVELEPIVA